MTTECRVCKNALLEPSAGGHAYERSPVDPGLCLGCWMATVELEKWIVRARPNRCYMGAWAEAWLAEILKDPHSLFR